MHVRMEGPLGRSLPSTLIAASKQNLQQTILYTMGEAQVIYCLNGVRGLSYCLAVPAETGLGLACCMTGL